MIPPDFTCDTGEALDSIHFRLEFATCEESRSTQAIFDDSCTDEGSLPATGSEAEVRVTCANLIDDSLIYSNTVEEGGAVAMEALPEEITCSIFSTEGDLLQAFMINTGGSVDLSLTDKFGSLSLEACNDADCMVEVTYSYNVENAGSVPVLVRKFERSQNGQVEDFLGDLRLPQIAPGGTESVKELRDIDTCVGEEYFVFLEVITIPPSGTECPAQADFFFPILEGCLVNVQIVCTTDDGVECQDLKAPADPADCEVEINYEYGIENVGTSTMNITAVDRTRNDERTSLMSELERVDLDPGEMTLITETETMDLCSGTEFRTTIVVEADPPNENTCFDDDTYNFELDPPCDVSLSMQCSSVENGINCADIEGEQSPTCNCDCAQELVYRYTAASCEAGLDGCADSGTNGLSSDITVSDGNVVLFEGRAQIGDDIVIRIGNECLPESLNAMVSPTRGDQPASQIVAIASGCAGREVLLDNFGAFQFVSYTCSDNIQHSCYTEVEYDIDISNGGAVSHSMTGWIFDLNGEIRGPGVRLPVLNPGQTFSKIEFAEIELCADGQYTAVADVTTVDDDGNECDDRESLSFAIVSGTPSPISIPATSPPTPSPTSGEETNPLPGETTADTPTLPPEFPASTCEFEMTIDCVPPFGASTCNATPPPVEQCSGRPYEMGFLYNGGDCSGSYNVQEEEGKFFCTDFGEGPPSRQGGSSFIVVTDLEGDIIFHSDFVRVGSVYTLSNGGETFPADQLINIYKNNNTEDPDAVLQSVQYHSSCSNNLFLKDRFGASQLVLWVNEDQGTVSCFANQTFNLDVTIPIDIDGGPATITGLTVASNIDPFFFNLTEGIAGTVAGAGATIQTAIAIPIDLSERRTYTLLMTLTAVLETGEQCTATEITSFVAGYPLPPIFPTSSPSQNRGRRTP